MSRKLPGGALVRASITATLVALAVFCGCLYKTGDPDLWWHLANGRHFIAHGPIRGADPFSFTGHVPAYSEYIAQALFFGWFKLGGVAAIVLGSALVLGVNAALALRLCAPGAVGVLAIGAWVYASWFRFVHKPQVFSDTCFIVLLLVLTAVENGRRRALWALPLVFLAWGHLHRGGLLGLVIVGVAVLAWLIDRERRDLVPLAVTVLALSAVALLFNWGGLDYYRTAIALSRNQAFRRHLAEWSSPSWEAVPRVLWPGLLLFAFWIAGRVRRPRLDRPTLTFLACVALAATGVRFVPYAVLAMLPQSSADLAALGARVKTIRPAVGAFAATAVGLALCMMHLVALPPSRIGLGFAAGRAPNDAAVFLQREPPPGPMLNAFNFGGYLLWAGQRVYVDGRNDTVYDEGFFDRAVRASAEPAVLREELTRWNIGFAVIDVDNGWRALVPRHREFDGFKRRLASRAAQQEPDTSAQA